ncbi:hypothetical protein NBRC10512_002125 [Rhodotorula toruloides]|uniref:RHTO0S18e00650g1_1 n=2 Tax=Rhodotorula toruloides TaxID=5286 RepID=A0A061BKJ7_RHOTO|nr:proteasomal ATPase-associated factor 1 [Rhodotorula toruloides NP11]EMS21391.1 proteasomal ATPase-associated factor 1 [Rhodotorula toruloides NP11]CDR48465.1 RHTO0S18e00650g1_1 [Rhodotorula toruloides]
MSAPAKVQSLPYIALQPSLPHVIADITHPRSTVAAENAWVSAYRLPSIPPDEAAKAKEGSVNGRIRVSEADEPGEVEVEGRDGVEVEMKSKSEFTIACPKLDIPPTPVLLPTPSLNADSTASTSANSGSQEAPAPSLLRLPARGGIESFALSGDERRVIVAGRDGQARAVEVVRFEEGASTRGKRLGKGKETALRGHVGDLTAAEFFPSNEVALTASSDMTLRVFSATDGSSPRVLKGHTKRVTGLAILRSASLGGPHKGREVISSSLDGTIKLWDVPTATATTTWTLSQPVSTMSVVQIGDEDAQDVRRGKFVLAAHSDGSISFFSLASQPVSGIHPATTVFRASSTSAIDALSTLSFHCSDTLVVAVGFRNGTVSVFSVPLSSLAHVAEPRQPISTWRRTEGSQIHSLRLSQRRATSHSPSPDDGLSILVASSDGMAYRAKLSLQDGAVEVAEEFVGPDCEPVTGICEDTAGRVWISAGGAHGGLRVYERAAAGV